MNNPPIYINVKNGWWYIPDEVAKQMANNPPKPGTLFGLPVVDVDGKWIAHPSVDPAKVEQIAEERVRQAFEEWYCRWSRDYTPPKRNGRGYCIAMVDEAWNGFQAGIGYAQKFPTQEGYSHCVPESR